MKKIFVPSLVVLFVAACVIYHFKVRAARKAALQTKAEEVAVVVPVSKPMLPGVPLGSVPVAAATVISGQRKFSSMTFGDQALALDPLRGQTPAELFQIWVESESSEHDRVKQQAVGELLKHSLQANSADPRMILEFQSFIGDGSIPPSEKVRLLQILGGAATKETLDLLMQTATAESDGTLKESAITAVSLVGSLRDDGSFHEELSPALERAWSNSDNHELLSSTALSMAKVGAPSGIKLLLSSALATESPADLRARTAEAVLLSATMNPHAIPVVTEALSTETAANAKSRIASGVLARIGKPTAIKALIVWFQNADETAATLVNNCVTKVNNNAELQIWESAVDSKVQFRSERNRQAIAAAVEAFRQRGKVKLGS